MSVRMSPPSDKAKQRLANFFGVRLRMVALIVVVGLAGGGIGAAYLWALDATTDLLGPDRWGGTEHIVVLASIGLLITVLVSVLGRPADVELLVGNIHVPGMTDDERSDADDDDGATDPRHHHDIEPAGRLRSLIPISLLSVGTGGTLGPEAPLVTTTGTLATRLARRNGLEPPDVRIIAITGMAAGFSVLFGAPLGAAVFALEIPHRRGLEYYEALIPATIGALCGFAVSTAFGRLGLEPIWDLPSVAPLDSVDLAWAVLAGALGAAIGIFFTLVVGVLHRVVEWIPSVSRPIAGGVALGLLALVTPYALTNGEFQIEALIESRPVVTTLLVACVFKVVGAAVALVTGWRGGFIIPLFFAGFALGWAVTDVLPIEHTWMFVAATMAAANVAVTKTPIGSTLVVTEMAGFALLPTTLIGSLASLVLTSQVGLLDSQRQRFDPFGHEHHHDRGTSATTGDR
ncbi:chloride channel protein [Ilumatobacter sp.]|uniref:chloride channel protein n=1 Tax=Ilumatobacter sp. TaxID=1967498 RepID=UPI003C5136A9